MRHLALGPVDDGSARRRPAGAPARLGQLVETPPEALSRITVSTLVVVGERDPRTSAAALAAAIPSAQYTTVPGDHDALGRPEMAAAVLAFLDARQ
ncbi:MAG: alpha/beta fold hydrolase [Acidimicrobiales bacterium]